MNELHILVAGKRCARVSDRGGTPRIHYDMSSEGVRAGLAISLSMPPRKEAYGGGCVQNWLENLLPENRLDLEAIARDTSGDLKACSTRNPLRMLEKIGEDCAGAIQVVRGERLEAVLNAGGIDPVSDADVEKMIREVRLGRAVAGRLPGSSQGRFSLAGAQRKTALRRLGDGSWGIPYGMEPTTHIMKPPITGMPGQVEGEHFCLRLCRATGLSAASSEVLEFGLETVICVERFDRLIAGNEKVVRVHVEDMCQALSVPPSRKYQSDGGPGATEICGEVLSRSVRADADRETFMQAMVTNWVLMGTDAHAKNYSVFVLPGAERPAAALAPLYDVNTFAPYPEASWNKGTMSMSVGGKYVFSQIHERHWRTACDRAGFFPAEGAEWLEKVIFDIREKAPAVAGKIIEEGLNPEWMKKLSSITSRRCEKVLSTLFPLKTYSFIEDYCPSEETNVETETPQPQP
ncbi:type II toxin-antitoxin system HipA family toxin [Acetobacter persici]|nr:type II toxin-antitoxin system HipA family toxin [Acetobacter persici]